MLLYEEKCCSSSRAAPTFSNNAALFIVVCESFPVNVEESALRILRGKYPKRMFKHISHTGAAEVADTLL